MCCLDDDTEFERQAWTTSTGSSVSRCRLDGDRRRLLGFLLLMMMMRWSLVQLLLTDGATRPKAGVGFKIAPLVTLVSQYPQGVSDGTSRMMTTRVSSGVPSWRYRS